MTDQQQPQGADQTRASPTKVTISSPGVSVLVESDADLDVVAAKAQQLHRDAVDRYGARPLPAGHGGVL